MSAQRIQLLVLDAQGVVLNAPLRAFLDDLAHRTGQSVAAMRTRWTQRLRLAAWTGAMTDERLWHELAPDAAPDLNPSCLLESRYAPGPAAAHLGRWHRRVPIWLLSNHRTHWLIPRLERFGLASHFDRILVSDQQGVAKPDAAAFEPVLANLSDPGAALFVDDSGQNVRAARSLGLTALLADQSIDWVAEIDSCLGMCRA